MYKQLVKLHTTPLPCKWFSDLVWSGDIIYNFKLGDFYRLLMFCQKYFQAYCKLTLACFTQVYIFRFYRFIKSIILNKSTF